jgi:hypothetical protein
MKGLFTLGLYIAIGVTGAAFGQSDYVKTIKTVPVPITGSDHVKMIKTDPVPVPPPPPPAVMPERPPATVIVINYGRGGRVDEHNMKYAAYKREKAKVQVRGPCYSACTLVTAYIGKDDLRLGVEPVISGWGAALVREMDAAVVILVRPSSTRPRA